MNDINKIVNTSFENQRKLANFCKTGVYNEIAGANHKNIRYYRKLIYNVFDDSLSSAFPLTYNLLTKTEWDGLINLFVSSNKCKSPQVWYMPKEFYLWLANSSLPILEKYKILPDLLKFEWFEIELYMKKNGRVLKKKSQNYILVNPDYLIMELNYPVHKVNASKITQNDFGQYFVLLHREKTDFKVIFTDISKSIALIIELFSSNQMSLIDLYQFIRQELGFELQEKEKKEIENFINWGNSSGLFY